MDIQQLIRSFLIPRDSDYARKLRANLGSAPYCINVNWKNNLYILSGKRRYSDFSRKEVRQSCGIIMDISDDHIVAYSYDFITDYIDSMKEQFVQNWNKYRVERVIDGAVMRVFFFNNCWNVSTLNCVDANDAFWSSQKSFRELFEECAAESGLDFSKLNQKYCYTFIIQHPHNHMVINCQSPRMLYLCTVDVSNDLPTYVSINDTGIIGVGDINFDSFQALEEELLRPEIVPLNKDSSLGFIIINIETGERTRIRRREYIKAQTLKGNHANINYRILEIILEDYKLHQSDSTHSHNRKTEFLHFFPQYKKNFYTLETKLHELCESLLSTYIDVYVKRARPLQTPQTLISLVQKHVFDEIYLNFLEDNQSIALGKVNRVVKSQNVWRIAGLLGISPVIKHHRMLTRKINPV
jgi:hypothetical protein